MPEKEWQRQNVGHNEALCPVDSRTSTVSDSLYICTTHIILVPWSAPCPKLDAAMPSPVHVTAL